MPIQFAIHRPPPSTTTTAMSALKLSITASSFCTKPYKWARNTTITISTTTATTASCSTFSLSLARRDWRRRITPCNNHNNYYYYLNSNNNINSSNRRNSLSGFSSFRGHKRFSFFSRNSSSSSKAGDFSGSDSAASSGSDFVASTDMGSDSKAVSWDHQNGHVNCQNQPPLLSSSDPKRQQQEQGSYSKLLTLPTVLTLGRVAAVPLLVYTFYMDSSLGRTATTSIFIAAAFTDWLDGYLARKMSLGSAFGAFLDPVADKLMVAATLVLLCSRPLEVAMFGQVPWLLTVPSIAIVGREITMSAVREWAASQDTKLLEAVAVNNLGKWKTATQMIALTILLAIRDSSNGGSGILMASGIVLLYISGGLSVWSLVVYMSKIWRVLLR